MILATAVKQAERWNAAILKFVPTKVEPGAPIWDGRLNGVIYEVFITQGSQNHEIENLNKVLFYNTIQFNIF